MKKTKVKEVGEGKRTGITSFGFDEQRKKEVRKKEK